MPVEWLNEKFNALALLPAEIHDKTTGTMLERTVLRELPDSLSHCGEGDWLVTLSLPSGYRISKEIHTGADGKVDIARLMPDFASSAGEVLKVALPSVATIPASASTILGNLKNIDWRSFAGNIAGLALEKALGDTKLLAGASGYGPVNSLQYPHAKLRFYRGSPLTGSIEAVPATDIKIEQTEGKAEILDRESRVLVVQLRRPECPALNIVLPPGCKLSLTMAAEGSTAAVSMSVAFGHPVVDRAVNLRADSSISDLLTIAGNLNERDVDSIVASSAGAAVCLLYLLLRARGDLLQYALDRLPAGAKEAPDARIVAGECRARRGEHPAAFQLFLDGFSRGLPFFGQGLSTMADRLGVYEKTVNPAETHFRLTKPEGFGAPNLDSLAGLVEKIEEFSICCDYSAPTMTYVGLQPDKPGSAALPRAEFLSDADFPINI